MAELNKKALGLTLGILWGFALFLVTLWILVSGGTGEHLELLGRFYLGYSVSYKGSLVGLAYGLVDGFITGWLIAFLYNLFAKKSQPQG